MVEPIPSQPTCLISIKWVVWTASIVADNIIGQIQTGGSNSVKLWGVPRGGIAPMFAVATSLVSKGKGVGYPADPEDAEFIIDDVWDRGTTEAKYKEIAPKATFLVLFDKRDPVFKDRWLVFPWERDRDDA